MESTSMQLCIENLNPFNGFAACYFVGIQWASIRERRPFAECEIRNTEKWNLPVDLPFIEAA